MRMIYKSINYTEILYHVLDPSGVVSGPTILTVPRKVPLSVAARIVKRQEGNRLILQTVEIIQYRKLYRTTWDAFLGIAEEVPTPPTILRGPA